LRQSPYAKENKETLDAWKLAVRKTHESVHELVLDQIEEIQAARLDWFKNAGFSR